MKNNRWKKALSIALVCCMLAGTEQGFTVHAQETAVQEQATVTGIKATPETLPEDGGTITVKATGTGLTSDNWGVKVEASLAGVGIAASKVKATVKEVKNDTAKIQVDENPMKNDIELKIIAGVKNGETITEQAETTVLMEKKTKETVLFDVKQLAQTGDHTVTATFGQEIQFGDADIEKTKSKIYIAEYSNIDNKIRTLTDEDTVKVEGNQLILQFKDALELTNSAALVVENSALKNDDNQYNKQVKWLISIKPTVSKIQLDKETLDYKGGTVHATLKGVRVDEIDVSSVEANLTPAGETTSGTPIEVTKGEAGPELTFNVPENTTDNTQSYTVNVKVNGTLVFEGNNGNLAEKAVVSVLAKGADPSAPTLGAMTITANNKLDMDDSNKSIKVFVSKQVGELKTVLRLYGTNFDAKKTKVRAIDENGIIFPVYDIPE